MPQWIHSLLVGFVMLVAVSSGWCLREPTATAAQTPTVVPAPVAYVAIEKAGSGPLPFTVVTKDGTEVARSDPERPGVVLPPGDYTLRVSQYAIPVTVPPASKLPQDVDFLAELRKSPRLSERYVNAENANFWLPVADGRLTRWYNSRSLYNGPFGFGWTFEYGTRLERTPEGDFEILGCVPPILCSQTRNMLILNSSRKIHPYPLW